ncbi:YxeA family protein [uncultured Vagococcus sp.]|uniref:YxeA family protein n=1 Tax=uncultured Vagococcus sp. TaxID=189676 RepID=UPI0028D0A278|nr:YxeA family protein [uncultured Vagococcus sp.]
MKKKILSITFLLMLLLGLFFAAPSLTRNNTSTTAMMIDLFNPRIGNSTLYVKTSDVYNDSYKDATSGQNDYTYITLGYDEDGNSRQIKYTSFGNKFTAHNYLKVRIKGQNVRSYEAVQPEDIPETALIKLD